VEKQNHTELLRLQFAELTERTPFCPEDQEIAEYFEGDLAGAERMKLENHLSDCRFCRARIGILERLEEVRTNTRVPGAVLATAKQLGHRVPVRWPRMAPAWATAAAVMITLFTLSGRNQEAVLETGVLPPAAPTTEVNSRQLRSLSREISNLNVLIPTPGADISPGTLIQWDEVPRNLHYNITILSYAGDVLWTQRVEGTDWVLDDSIHLAQGSKYNFRVEARLADGRIVRSKHVPFQLARQQ